MVARELSGPPRRDFLRLLSAMKLGSISKEIRVGDAD
jgi:hypothetical protein